MRVALFAMHWKALDDRALLSSLNAVDHVQGGAVQGSFSGLCLLSLWPPLQCLVAVALCQSSMAILSHAQSPTSWVQADRGPCPARSWQGPAHQCLCPAGSFPT